MGRVLGSFKEIYRISGVKGERHRRGFRQDKDTYFSSFVLPNNLNTEDYVNTSGWKEILSKKFEEKGRGILPVPSASTSCFGPCTVTHDYSWILFVFICHRLSELGRQVGARILDVLVLREKGLKRETRVLNILLFIKSTLWKVRGSLTKYPDLNSPNLPWTKCMNSVGRIGS